MTKAVMRLQTEAERLNAAGIDAELTFGANSTFSSYEYNINRARSTMLSGAKGSRGSLQVIRIQIVLRGGDTGVVWVCLSYIPFCQKCARRDGTVCDCTCLTSTAPIA